MSSSFLIRPPDEIATRLRATVPPRQRNQFIANLVAQALARQDDELARIADQVTEEERDRALRRELDTWERTIIRDGIDEPV